MKHLCNFTLWFVQVIPICSSPKISFPALFICYSYFSTCSGVLKVAQFRVFDRLEIQSNWLMLLVFLYWMPQMTIYWADKIKPYGSIASSLSYSFASQSDTYCPIIRILILLAQLHGLQLDLNKMIQGSDIQPSPQRSVLLKLFMQNIFWFIASSIPLSNICTTQ